MGEPFVAATCDVVELVIKDLHIEDDAPETKWGRTRELLRERRAARVLSHGAPLEVYDDKDLVPELEQVLTDAFLLASKADIEDREIPSHVADVMLAMVSYMSMMLQRHRSKG